MSGCKARLMIAGVRVGLVQCYQSRQPADVTMCCHSRHLGKQHGITKNLLNMQYISI